MLEEIGGKNGGGSSGQDSKREAYRGRGNPLEWGLVRRSKKEIITKWNEDCWARLFALFRECSLQRRQSMHEDSTEEEEMRRQHRIKVRKDMTRKIRSKKKNGCREPMVGC